MYQIEVKSYDHQGRGLGKLNDKTIFINNALPNEIVDVDITKDKKNYLEGKVISYVEKSNKRIEPLCPYFNICGGCDIMHISYDEQLNFKREKIENIVNRYCDFSFPIKDIIGSEETLYRNKVTFHVKDNKIGYFKEKSNNLIDIDKCYLLDNNIDKIYQVIKNNANLKHIDSIVIRASKYINDNIVILYTNGYINEKEWITLLDKCVNNIVISYNKEFKVIKGNNYIIEKLLDKKFIIKNDAFFQVNTLGTEKLYSKVLEYADINSNETVLDLYCGTGTIGILASKYAKEVVGIELNKEAVKSANENKAINNVDNIKFYVGDTGTILKQNNYHVDTVIVDPPRAGLDDLAITEIFKINSKKLVYVSCDPMTLMRDLNKLQEKYNILELTPVDMFPNTAHVECVCLLLLK